MWASEVTTLWRYTNLFIIIIIIIIMIIIFIHLSTDRVQKSTEAQQAGRLVKKEQSVKQASK